MIGLLLIVLGIVLFLLGHWLVGLILIALGCVLGVAWAGPPRRW